MNVEMESSSARRVLTYFALHYYLFTVHNILKNYKKEKGGKERKGKRQNANIHIFFFIEV